MDMSLARPYGGPNRLADRLLAIEEVRESHQRIVRELATTILRKERLLTDVAAIETATRQIVEREAAARAERAEPPVGFGPPGAPTAPDLRTFAERRSLSIADQLAGKKDGYRPQFSFGPQGGNRNTALKPVDDQTIGEVVKAPAGFKVSLFAAPPGWATRWPFRWPRTARCTWPSTSRDRSAGPPGAAASCAAWTRTATAGPTA